MGRARRLPYLHPRRRRRAAGVHGLDVARLAPAHHEAPADRVPDDLGRKTTVSNPQTALVPSLQERGGPRVNAGWRQPPPARLRAVGTELPASIANTGPHVYAEAVAEKRLSEERSCLCEAPAP